jgi:hypothetical protein
MVRLLPTDLSADELGKTMRKSSERFFPKKPIGKGE